MVMSSRTRKVWILTAAVLLAAAALFVPAVEAAGKGNKWTALRYRFKPGQKIEYGLTMNESGTSALSMGGKRQEMPVNTITKTTFRYEVLDVDSEGTATVKLSADEITVDSQAMGQSANIKVGASGLKVSSGGMMIVDSPQIDDVQGRPVEEMMGLGGVPEGVQFSELFRQGITVKISNTGEITLAESAQSGSEYLGVLEHFELERLPERLVRPGDRWITGLSLPGLDEERAKLNGLVAEQVFEGFDFFNGRRCAKIVTTIDVDLSGRGDVLQLMPNVNALKSTGERAAYLDVESGRVLKLEGTTSQEARTVQTIGAQGAGAGAGTQGMEISSSMKVAVEYQLKE
jgi:hypothetical protein